MVRTGGLGLWALVGLLAQTPAWAQGAPASDDAQAADRMDRARRAADSPMKRIQEAARLAPPPPAARPPSVTVQLPARKPASPAAPAALPAPTPTGPVPEAPVTPVAATASAPVPAVAAEPVSMPAAPPAPSPPPSPPPAPEAPPAAPAAPVTPVLVSMVEPQFPLSFDPAQVGGDLRFLVRFSIKPDGRVSDVKVQGGPNDRGVRNAVRQAVERWQYAPVPQDLPHEVELVLKLQG